jgi:hypothetical protein
MVGDHAPSMEIALCILMRNINFDKDLPGDNLPYNDRIGHRGFGKAGVFCKERGASCP